MFMIQRKQSTLRSCDADALLILVTFHVSNKQSNAMDSQNDELWFMMSRVVKKRRDGRCSEEVSGFGLALVISFPKHHGYDV